MKRVSLADICAWKAEQVPTEPPVRISERKYQQVCSNFYAALREALRNILRGRPEMRAVNVLIRKKFVALFDMHSSAFERASFDCLDLDIRHVFPIVLEFLPHLLEKPIHMKTDKTCDRFELWFDEK